MTFKEEFDELYSRVDVPFKAYIQCSETLLKNEQLKLFLCLVLTIGNFLNANSYAGKAYGFKINILSKLNEVKTNIFSINLLHIIVEQYDELCKENADNFLNELKDIGIVLCNGYSNMTNDFNLLKRNTNDLYKQINNENTQDDIRKQFASTFSVIILNHASNKLN